VSRFIDHSHVITTNNYNFIATSTLYNSLKHTVQYSQSVTRCFLAAAQTTVILCLQVQVLSPQTPVENWLSSNLIPCLHLGSDHIENTALLLLRSCLLLWEYVYRAVAQKQPWHICLSRGSYIATAVNTTIINEGESSSYKAIKKDALTFSATQSSLPCSEKIDLTKNKYTYAY
jgi:hypothetical protein